MKSFHDGKITLHAGDCLDVLKAMPENSIDAVVTDPPYHLTSIVKRYSGETPRSNMHDKDRGNIQALQYKRLAKGFMGKQWDGGDIAFRPELWAEVLRILKPGGHMVAFSGTRTYHRMVCAIEDAGFEIRDQLAWVFGSGFPKSHDVSKGIDRAAGVERTVRTGVKPGHENFAGRDNHPLNGGWDRPWASDSEAVDRYHSTFAPATEAARQWQGYGTALKPSFEPVCLARKPLSESTVAANVLRWGTGALNIDATRIKSEGENLTRECLGWASAKEEGYRRPWMDTAEKQVLGSTNGRWPANLCHDGSPEVLAGFPETTTGSHKPYAQNVKGWKNSCDVNTFENEGDAGSAARFFASFPQEETQCQSLSGHASYAESSFILSSEAVVSALSRAVEASTQRLVLHQPSYQAQDTSVSGQLLDEIETLLTGTILNIEKRFLRGLQPTKHSLSSNLASIAAVPNRIGTTKITISLSKSNGFAEAATFDCIETNSEAGEPASAKRFHYTSKANADDRLNSKHPTVKPVDLMQWLVRLVCPKGATVLDPFAGTGTTGAAAFIEGCRCVLIEREAEYLADIEKRMGMLLSGSEERSWKLAKPEPLEALPLFALPEPAE